MVTLKRGIFRFQDLCGFFSRNFHETVTVHCVLMVCKKSASFLQFSSHLHALIYPFPAFYADQPTDKQWLHNVNFSLVFKLNVQNPFLSLYF